MKILIKNAMVYTKNNLIEQGFLYLEDNKIIDYGLMSENKYVVDEEIDAKGLNVIPGFIDQHIHGAAGYDVMDADEKGLAIMAKALLKEGTTSFLATTLTQDDKDIINALKSVSNYTKNPSLGANVLGAHLEGPFFNVKYKGAQNELFIQKPSLEVFNEYQKQSDNIIKIISYAPELADASFTVNLDKQGIVQSVAHSDATYEDVEKAYDLGLTNITHFHNGSSGYHHRFPGVVNAALGLDVNVELICDNIHIHHDTIKATYKIKTSDKIILITDSMRAKGLENGTYDLGGLVVTKMDNEVRTVSGSLAGSVATMDLCARNFKNFTKCSMQEIVKVTSTNSATQLKIDDHKGYIEKGYDADIVICDDDINIKYTIVNGVVGYKG